MEVGLAYLAQSGYYSQIGYTYGIAKSTVILYVQNIINFLFASAEHHINLPTPDEYNNLVKRVRDHKVILYIDGFITKITRPNNAGDAYYCGRPGKACDSLNVQLIVDKNGFVRHILSGIPGSSHDKHAIEWSTEFMDYLNTLEAPYCILGDPAYRGLHDRVITTYIGEGLNERQLEFNSECTRLRQIVERSINALQIQWRFLQCKDNRFPAKLNHSLASKATIAAAVCTIDLQIF